MVLGGWRGVAYSQFEFVPKTQAMDIAPAMFTVKIDSARAINGLKEFRAMVPYVAANTLTELGRATQERMPTVLQRRFDRPTPYTLRSVRVDFANKTKLRSVVGFPDSEEASGKSKNEFMRPGALGTTSRRQKRSEFMLSQKGWLPPGWITVPGSHAKRALLDAHGNIPGSVYKQMVNSLQIKKGGKAVSKASQKRAARLGVANEFFAVAPGANTLGRNGGYLPAGVYRRTAKGLQQYLLFIKRASYEKRVDMRQVGIETAQQKGQAIVQAVFRDVQQKFAAYASKRAGR